MAALKFKVPFLKTVIKAKGQFFSYGIMLIIWPIVIFALFTKLKPTDTFTFEESGRQHFHNGKTAELLWNRFSAYRESPILYLLEFIKQNDNDPNHVSIPKKLLTGDLAKAFINLLTEHIKPANWQALLHVTPLTCNKAL